MFVVELWCEKDENKQKEAGIGAYLKKLGPIFYLKLAIPGLFFLIFGFSIQLIENFQHKFLPTEPQPLSYYVQLLRMQNLQANRFQLHWPPPQVIKNDGIFSGQSWRVEN